MMVLGVLVASWCARGLAFAPAAPAASARGAPLAAQVRKVGIVGGGTVGGGIVEILERRREQLVAATGGVGLEVKAVVVRDAAKARDWTAPPGCVVTEDLEAVLGQLSLRTLTLYANPLCASESGYPDVLLRVQPAWPSWQRCGGVACGSDSRADGPRVGKLPFALAPPFFLPPRFSLGAPTHDAMPTCE